MNYYCAVTMDGRYLTMNGYQPSLTTAKGLARVVADESTMRIEADIASRIIGEPLSVLYFN